MSEISANSGSELKSSEEKLKVFFESLDGMILKHPWIDEKIWKFIKNISYSGLPEEKLKTFIKEEFPELSEEEQELLFWAYKAFDEISPIEIICMNGVKIKELVEKLVQKVLKILFSKKD